MLKGASVQVNGVAVPVKSIDTTVAVRVLISSGIRLLRLRLKNSISSVNRIPARGALKMPAIAPAAPHPTRTVMFLYPRLKALPMLLPIAAPV